MDLLSKLRHGPEVSLNFKREVEEGVVIIPPRIAEYVGEMNFHVLTGQRITDIPEIGPHLGYDPRAPFAEGICVYDPVTDVALIGLAEFSADYHIPGVKKNTVHEVLHAVDGGNMLVKNNKIVRGRFSDEPRFVGAYERDLVMAEITSNAAKRIPGSGVDIDTLDYQREGDGVGRKEVWTNQAVHLITGSAFAGTLPISFGRSGQVVAAQFERMDWMEETVVGRALKAEQEKPIKGPRFDY